MFATPYEILGLPPDATSREIRLAYANLLKSCDQEHELERFQAIRAAYEWAIQIARDNERSNEPAESASPQIQIGTAAINGAYPSPSPHSISGHEPGRFVAETHTEPTFHTPHQAESAPTPNTSASSAAQTALQALAEAYRAEPDARPMDLLIASLGSATLMAIDEREHFEQLLLTWIFEPKLKIAFLDAAAAHLGWETVNRHLYDSRPDLAWRMSRHQALSHMINVLPEAKRVLADAEYYFDYIREFDHFRNSQYEIPRTLIHDLAAVLSPLMEAYPAEMRERFSKHIDDWQEETPNTVASSSTKTARNSFFPPAGTSIIYAPVLTVFLITILLGMFGHSSPRKTPPPPYTNEQMQQIMPCPLQDESLRTIAALKETQTLVLPKPCQQRLEQLKIQLEQTSLQFPPPPLPIPVEKK